MLHGFDASSVQDEIPWKSLFDAGIRFVILKAQTGNDGIDPSFERNVKAALDHGIEPFAYCFFYPLTPDEAHPSRDAKEQARRFVEAVHRIPEMRKRPIFLDEEWPEIGDWAKWGLTAKLISERMRANAEEVQRLSGVAPILYTYLYWWKAIAAKTDVSWAKAFALWMAWYVQGWPGENSKPTVVEPWTEALFWQFDGNGGLLLPNGRDADFNVFMGTEDDLRRLAGRAGGPVDSVSGDVIEDEASRAG